MQQFRTSDRARNMKLNTSTNVVAYSPCGFEMFYFFRFFFHHTVIIGYKLAPQQLSKAFFFFCFVIPATSPIKQALIVAFERVEVYSRYCSAVYVYPVN